MDTDSAFYDDAQVARLFTMSRSWVRQERMHRKRGERHFLTLDPVMIASRPRYRRQQVEDFIANLPNSGDSEHAPQA